MSLNLFSLNARGLSLGLAMIAAVAVPIAPAGAADENHPPKVDVAELVPSPQHRRATRLILDLMRRYHYRKVEVDDALSEQMFEKFLDTLDPNRSFLLATDVESFSHYRRQFDDALRDTELLPAYDIFKKFRTRIEERANYAISLLSYDFDYTRDETYLFDREKQAWAKSEGELDEFWRKRVKNDILELRLGGRKPDEITKTLTKRYQRMGRRVAQLRANDVYQFFVNSYTVSIEPHTAYFSPRSSENFKIRMTLSLEGIGAALQTENEHTVVRRIIAGGPAALSGKLHVDDRIIGVGQGMDSEIVDVISWRLEDVVDLIRGPKTSVVRLQILPGDAPPGTPPSTIALVRDTINLEERAAKSSIIETKSGQDTVKVGGNRRPDVLSRFSRSSPGYPELSQHHPGRPKAGQEAHRGRRGGYRHRPAGK